MGVSTVLVMLAIFSADAAAPADVAVDREERFWRSVAADEPPPTTSARRLFGYALSLCEARRHPERLTRLYDLAARMQDRDPASRTCGNLRWTWRDAAVTDQNAVEFTMLDAALAWRRHRQWMPEPARARLRRLMELGASGCLSHRVPTSYTNIAILNAANLMVLGDTLARTDATAEGRRRLDALCLWTWYFGLYEYSSPTYYGVNLDGLGMLALFAAEAAVREQAEALRQYVWNDIAASWFAPAERLAGSQSRSYDYVRGRGYLDLHASLAGWLNRPPAGGEEALHARLLHLPPPASSVAVAAAGTRLVAQRWGMRPNQWRTVWLHPDGAIGSSAATYPSWQDFPLAVDLPGSALDPRCYFIPDGREDPYGQKRYETSSARHMKALHLNVFWTAAQRQGDVLGLAVYPASSLAGNELVNNCQSHFVLRRPTDGIWLGGKRAELPAGTASQPARLPVGSGEALAVRYGGAAVGVRVVVARRQDGNRASIALVDDGNPHGVIRLTIEHRSEAHSVAPAAALWVRLGTGMKDADGFDRWQAAFAAAEVKTNALTADRIRLAVVGEDGPLAVDAAAPWEVAGNASVRPPPGELLLGVDGREIGRPLLERLPIVATGQPGINPLRPLAIAGKGPWQWQAEDGWIFAGMEKGQEGQPPTAFIASTGHDKRRTTGSVVWALRAERPGRYLLWGRVRGDNPESDSFNLRLDAADAPAGKPAAWHFRPQGQWSWQRVHLDRAREPAVFELPAGVSYLHLTTREPGAKIDQLLLVADPAYRPR